MEGLLAVSPYLNGPFDSRAKGVAECRCRGTLGPEPACQRALHGLPQAQARGMVLRGPKRPASKQPAVDADEPAPAAGDQEEATEANAPSGGGDGRGFVLD